MPMPAEMKRATVKSEIPSTQWKNTRVGFASSVDVSPEWVPLVCFWKGRVQLNIGHKQIIDLTISVPETMVHRIMPKVISRTEKYLDMGYRLPRIIIPMTMLAIREPWKNKNYNL